MKAVSDFFLGEWYFALPLVIMSLVAGALVIWRLLLNVSANTDMDDFLPVFQQTLRKNGIKGAVALCKEEKGLIPSRLFVAGLEAADQGTAAMRRSIANETELEVLPRLHFLLAPILAIAKIATMVGLFFTVISMINTFDAIGRESAAGKVKEIGGHSSKIGLALFATALGLFTAIPLVFSHVLFKEWISRFEVKIKAASQKLITLVTNYKKDPKLLDQVLELDADEREDAKAGAKGRVVAKAPKAFDVWFVAANTVYKAVPYSVVADWTQEGRLAPTDMVRPAGSTMAWVTVAEHDLLVDYVPRPAPAKAVPATAPAAVAAGAVAAGAVATASEPAGERVELPEPEPEHYRQPVGGEDDDVDMIPLIDISMVLLVFFIMIKAAGALAPVDVPEMKYGGQLSADPEAITITVDKLNERDVYYSVRVGQTAPKPEHDLLPTPEKAVAALNELLAGVPRPPEVRIACVKELPRERVYELRRELEPLQKKNQINNIIATVIEAPKEK